MAWVKIVDRLPCWNNADQKGEVLYRVSDEVNVHSDKLAKLQSYGESAFESPIEWWEDDSQNARPTVTGKWVRFKDRRPRDEDNNGDNQILWRPIGGSHLNRNSASVLRGAYPRSGLDHSEWYEGGFYDLG